MKNILYKYAAALLCISILSCSSEQDAVDIVNPSQQNIVSVAFANITSRSDEGEVLGDESETETETETTDTFFVIGDQITVVGAATESVTFTLNDQGEWISINPYEWIEAPQTVYAYFGQGASVADGEQMPDLYVAKYECDGVKPEGGLLAFTADKAFKHTSALIKVQVNNLVTTIPPTVQLSSLHQISYINTDGTYQKDETTIKSITFDMTASSGTSYTFEAKIPSGEGSLLSDYQLVVKDENVFNYVANTSAIPSYFEANKVYTFTVNYLDEE